MPAQKPVNRQRPGAAETQGEKPGAVEKILNPAVGASNGQRAGKNFNLWL